MSGPALMADPLIVSPAQAGFPDVSKTYPEHPKARPKKDARGGDGQICRLTNTEIPRYGKSEIRKSAIASSFR